MCDRLYKYLYKCLEYCFQNFNKLQYEDYEIFVKSAKDAISSHFLD